MIFYTVLFAASWTAFLFFADRKRFFELSPTCYLAMVLGLATDLMTMYYPLWGCGSVIPAERLWCQLSEDFGVYFVTTYLFLQVLPSKTDVGGVLRYIFSWTVFAILLEGAAVITGNMKYGLWWHMKYSYLADWVLYLGFMAHHRWRENNK